MKKAWVLTSFLTSVITNEWNLSLLYFISFFFFYWNKPTCTQFYWSLIEVLSKSDSNTALVTKRTPLNFCWTTHCKLNKKKKIKSMQDCADFCLIRHTLTRSSFIGWGISRPRIWVTMGPSVPGTMIWSPSWMLPLTSITSIVVPRPGRAFT